MKKNVLFIDGVADNQLVKVVAITPDGTSFDIGGSCNLFNTLDSNSFNKYHTLLDANPTSSINLNGVDLIFNQISEFDTFKNSLAKVDAILNNSKIPCLNKPTHILNTTRDSIYEKLQNINKLIVPKTIRIKPLSPTDIIQDIKTSKILYPVIIRDCGYHGDSQTHLVKNEQEIKELYSIALDGREYYLTQYHEYLDKESLYKKYRLAVVDGEVFIVHAIVSKTWMVHQNSQLQRFKDKENQINSHFESTIKQHIKTTISEIKSKIGLDYFGIDCSIDEDYNICIFEVNANMNMLINKNADNKYYLEQIEDALNSMILK